MAQQKRGKPTTSGSKKQSVAKHSLKKKHLSSIKSKNDQLREKLDQQAQSLYPLQTHTTTSVIASDLYSKPSFAETDVDQVTAILESFCQ